MIYFKITDKESEAWSRHQEYMALRNEAFDQVKALTKELGIETKEFTAHLGNVTSFQYEDGQHRPTGMVIRKGKLVPNNRSNAGKEIKSKLEKIHFPTQYEYMKMMFGASGEAMEGSSYYTGCGLTCNADKVLIKCRVAVFDNAKEKEDFEVPEGCVEIKSSEYHAIYEKMFSKNDN